ncbi:glycosyl hydrolase-related protein [Thermodesulfobacteriota bacterium]
MNARAVGWLVVLFSMVCTSIAASEFPLETGLIQVGATVPHDEYIAPFADLRISDVFPTSFFIQDSGTLCQVVIVRVENRSTAAAACTIETAGPGSAGSAVEEIVLPPGPRDVTFLLPDKRLPGTMEMTLLCNEEFQQRLVFDWEPARLWSVYVVQTSHFDHGYTGTQQRVMEKRDRILDDVLDYCSLTDDWPEDARFRWMVEASFCLNHYMESRPWRAEELGRRISEGRIEIGAKFCHMHSSTAGHEEIVRNIYNSTVRLSELFGAQVLTANHNDVVGITWGSVAAWAGAGIRYFSYNPNPFYRGGNILHRTGAPQAYYWAGANDERILTWRSRIGYSEGRFLIDGLDRTLAELPRLLESYEEEGYPYDAIHLTRTGLDETPLLEVNDNCLPRFEICDTIRQWNEIFEYPRLICATSAQFFGYLEENFASRIPELRGDCPDWWADGVVTGATAEGRARRLHHKLFEAEALASVASIIDPDSEYPAGGLERAWENTILFDEHTWGTILPFLPPQGAIWNKKVEDMDEAALTCDGIAGQAAGRMAGRVRGDGWRLFVFNAMSWDRDDFVLWRPPAGFPQDPLGSGFFLIINEDGESVPYQISVDRDGGIEVAFVARDVPSVGYRTYRIVPADDPPAFACDLITGEFSLENEHYRLVMDPEAGVTGLRDLDLDRELVDDEAPWLLNEFISRRQGLLDQHDTRRRGSVGIFGLKEAGPVYASALFEVTDPDRRACTIEQEIRVYDGLRRVDFINRVENFSNLPGQSKYFAFPFDVPDFEFRIDIPMAVMRPFHEQLPDHAKYYAVQHWVDVSSPAEDFGVTWATVQGPMVELGEITKPSCWWAIVDPLYYDPGEYPYDPVYSHIYSEIMNNFQNTNFNYHQRGSGEWRYAVTSHEGQWDQPSVTRFGWGLASPLQVRFFEASPEGLLPDSLGFFRVDQENVKILAVKAADDGDGLIVRLFENEGRATRVSLEAPLLKKMQATLVDLAEREIEPLACRNGSLAVDIGAFGLATVRIKGESAFGSGGDDGSDPGGCGCAVFGTATGRGSLRLAVAGSTYFLPGIFIALMRLRGRRRTPAPLTEVHK